ncbi:hypothetical protein [Actinomadura mexicana]|uniref:Uncharacterized protein n=1 Tax=Actinomadura mexicana TaxID=134959 RepID=A0A238XAZ5_9ACTN|nr:hypothetical protein [Actinomadura mexicana]SNR56117.1 hypothetical protein SAMN06265355_104158 [Actinomadura mexicana]
MEVGGPEPPAEHRRPDRPAAAQTLLKIVSDDPPLRVLFGQGFYPTIQRTYADRIKMREDGQNLSAAAYGNSID